LSERAGAEGIAGEYEYVSPVAEKPDKIANGGDADEVADSKKLTPFISATRPKRASSGAMSDYKWEPRPPQKVWCRTACID